MRQHAKRGPETAPAVASRPSQRGFTMVELVLAMLVLVLGVGAVYTMTCSMSRERQLGEERQRAYLACKRRIEELRVTDWALLPTLDRSAFDIDTDSDGVNELRATATSGRPGLVRVLPHAVSGTGETIYRVTATASWNGVVGQQTFSIETLVANRYAQ